MVKQSVRDARIRLGPYEGCNCCRHLDRDGRWRGFVLHAQSFFWPQQLVCFLRGSCFWLRVIAPSPRRSCVFGSVPDGFAGFLPASSRECGGGAGDLASLFAQTSKRAACAPGRGSSAETRKQRAFFLWFVIAWPSNRSSSERSSSPRRNSATI